MNRHINELLQIQDMLFILRENDILHKREKSEDTISKTLQDNIRAMEELLPNNILTEYKRISARYEVFVMPMINDACTGCFMKLPVGIASHVKNTGMCVACPNCHRFLYEDFQTDRPQDNKHYKGVARFSAQELMIPELQSQTHEDALKEIAGICAAQKFVENEEIFTEAVLNREAMSSTAVGSGIAFPHARGIRACGLTLAVAMSKDGIDFGSDEKVNLIFMSAVPLQTSMFYLELVSKLARYYGKTKNVEKMLDCTTSEEMWKLFVKVGK
jgi:mannitol/fructose-specific phosphotransferase system IIA component (Ntr-type)